MHLWCVTCLESAALFSCSEIRVENQDARGPGYGPFFIVFPQKRGENSFFLTRNRLQFECFLGLHDPLDNLFGQGFATRQLVDGLDYLGVGFPLILQILGPTVIDVVLFGQFVQSIDAWIAPLQALLEFGARPHVLIAGPVKFDSRLGPPFLKVEAVRTFFACLGVVGLSHHLG